MLFFNQNPLYAFFFGRLIHYLKGSFRKRWSNGEIGRERGKREILSAASLHSGHNSRGCTGRSQYFFWVPHVANRAPRTPAILYYFPRHTGRELSCKQHFQYTNQHSYGMPVSQPGVYSTLPEYWPQNSSVFLFLNAQLRKSDKKQW